MKQRDRLEAAAMMERLIQAVDDGGLDADGPAGAGLVKRMQGAYEALVHRPSHPATQDHV